MANWALIKRAGNSLFGQTKAVFSKHALYSSHAGAATSKTLVEIKQDETTGFTTLSMNRAPVNSLNLDLIKDLQKALETAVDQKSKGIILTSSLPTVFSAGLDIMEMYKPDMKRCTEFWHSLQELWLTLYGISTPTVAAINGASPAGGCLLGLSCEYRIMVQGQHTIGLNETKLGIVAPKWFQDSMIAAIGYRQSELALMRGSLFKPEEALKIGLIDEIASDKNDALVKAERYLHSYAKIPADAREATKLSMRKDTLAWLEQNREWDSTIFLNYVKLPQVQKGLDLYVQSLKAKSK